MPSDEDLARLAQQGCHRSFATLVERFQHRIYGFVRRRVNSPHDAEDVAQATFVRAWRSLPTYDPARPFATWLFTIAARASAGHIRSARPTRALPADPPQTPQHHPAADRLADRDAGRLAWQLAHRLLPPDHYTALWLRYVENMPTRDIADILGRTDVSVRVLLHRARETIAAEMARLGNTGADPHQ